MKTAWVVLSIAVMLLSACELKQARTGRDMYSMDREYEGGVEGEDSRSSGNLLAVGKTTIGQMRKECPADQDISGPPPFQIVATLLHEHYGALTWEEYPFSSVNDPHALDFENQRYYRWLFNPDINLLARMWWTGLDLDFFAKERAGIETGIKEHPQHVDFYTVKPDSEWKKKVLALAEAGRLKRHTGGKDYPDFTDLLPSCIRQGDPERGIYKVTDNIEFVKKLKEVLPIVVQEIKQQPTRKQRALTPQQQQAQANIDRYLAQQGTSRQQIQEEQNATAEENPTEEVYVKRRRRDEWMDKTVILSSGGYKNLIYYQCPAELLGCTNGFIKGFSELSRPEIQEKMK